MPNLSTVLFDLDGTLIDSVRLILDSYHHTLAAHGIPPRTDDEWLRGVGTPLTVQFAPWKDHPGIEAMIATYRDYNLAHHDSCVTPYPGVVEAADHVVRDLVGLVLQALDGVDDRPAGGRRGPEQVLQEARGLHIQLGDRREEVEELLVAGEQAHAEGLVTRWWAGKIPRARQVAKTGR
jgi:hypothetical protein